MALSKITRRQVFAVAIAIPVAAAAKSVTDQSTVGKLLYPRTGAEIAAGITPLDSSFPELNVLRYGASATNTGAQNAAAIQAGISVLAQHTEAELLIPEGVNLNVTQLAFTSMSQFNVRCDGTLVSTVAAPGGAFTNQTPSQGTSAVMRFSSCSRFKVYGKGHINPDNVDALNVTRCSNFDWNLDMRGTGANTFMRGALFRECNQFRIHGCTIESLTGQNFQTCLTATTSIGAGATSAMAKTWTLGAGVFTIAFSDAEVRQVTFGSGTSNVRMSWKGGLSNNVTSALFVEIYYNWLDSLAFFSCFNFKVDHNIVRKSGANGIYVLSVAAGGEFELAHDFDICDNICELNAESGIQVTYSGGTSCPIFYRVNNNTVRYNQADGIDAANTGSFANVYAQFNNNTHINNGWIGCDPSNPGGVDGSGIGTFSNIGEFEAVGNTVFNCNNAGIFVSGCTSWRIANNTINKGFNAGSSQGGCFISTSHSGSLTGNDITTRKGVPPLTVQSCTNVVMCANNFTSGAL
ncbi:MAG TPA: hypothetical protein VK794_07000 [Steroidobacteraceae bacterium]|jgi:hypothetical protein|nr:hypothetical protein [Steroidobacteraceae bacterium]